jgi:uncharacterized protein (UPF0305 family)
MTELKKEAINLMLEDLYTIRSDIRERAKVLGCEKELNEIKKCLIEYLDSFNT